MKGERQEILYLDMWVGERIQEMKLAGIRRPLRLSVGHRAPQGLPALHRQVPRRLAQGEPEFMI